MVPESSDAKQMQSSDTRFSLSESLEQLAAASESLANLLLAATGGASNIASTERETRPSPRMEEAKGILTKLFDKESIDGYYASEEMERARVAHLDAALEIYEIMADGDSSVVPGEFENYEELASAIGNALLKELTELYQFKTRGSDRTTFTTEQRTALESAFLVKPKLNTAEKRALAKSCNLNPRQVEVWVREPWDLPS